MGLVSLMARVRLLVPQWCFSSGGYSGFRPFSYSSCDSFLMAGTHDRKAWALRQHPCSLIGNLMLAAGEI